MHAAIDQRQIMFNRTLDWLTASHCRHCTARRVSHS